MNSLEFEILKYNYHLSLPFPIQDEVRKFTKIFIFKLLCGASKAFKKTLKAFIKLFEGPQSKKIKT